MATIHIEGSIVKGGLVVKAMSESGENAGDVATVLLNGTYHILSNLIKTHQNECGEKDCSFEAKLLPMLADLQKHRATPEEREKYIANKLSRL